MCSTEANLLRLAKEKPVFPLAFWLFWILFSLSPRPLSVSPRPKPRAPLWRFPFFFRRHSVLSVSVSPFSSPVASFFSFPLFPSFRALPPFSGNFLQKNSRIYLLLSQEFSTFAPAFERETPCIWSDDALSLSHRTARFFSLLFFNKKRIPKVWKVKIKSISLHPRFAPSDWEVEAKKEIFERNYIIQYK